MPVPIKGFCHQHVPHPSVLCPRSDCFLSAWIVNLWVVQWSPRSPTRCLAPARGPVTVGSVRGEHGCDVRDGTQALEGVQSGPRSPLLKLRIEWYFACSAASLIIPGLFSSCLSENQLFVWEQAPSPVAGKESPVHRRLELTAWPVWASPEGGCRDIVSCPWRRTFQTVPLVRAQGGCDIKRSVSCSFSSEEIKVILKSLKPAEHICLRKTWGQAVPRTSASPLQGSPRALPAPLVLNEERSLGDKKGFLRALCPRLSASSTPSPRSVPRGP